MSQIYCHREIATAEITTLVCKTDNCIPFPSSLLSSNQQINLSLTCYVEFNKDLFCVVQSPFPSTIWAILTSIPNSKI